MPQPTPFHARTAPLCESWEWRNWSGYLAASLYEPTHEREYFAIRNSVALIDISPLFKVEVNGRDAQQLVDRIMTRDISACRVGQVMYSPWCDPTGKVIDDGTITRLAPDRFRITAAHPNLHWFQDAAQGLDVDVTDVSSALAALALQGPKSRALLSQVVEGIDFDSLRYYRAATGTFHGRGLTVTRTGYTGDLGYELWLAPAHAVDLWDALVHHGAAYAAQPAGMLALDIARIEAGLLLIDVDYISARRALIPAQQSSPYELGLGWAVNLDGGDFIGKAALQAAAERPPRWAFAGLSVGWFELERHYNALGLRPPVAGQRALRQPVPVYHNGRQVGQATSQVFSPLLKRTIALATLEAEFALPGTPLELEMTVEFSRRRAAATVSRLPFYRPAHARA